MGAIGRLNFDSLARPYRWLEYATFGHALERCRFHFLPRLTHARKALVLGDGDGRFLARLLDINPELRADVIDISPAMLQLLQKKLAPEARCRITIYPADARDFTFPETLYDLVVTHFFLDCLSTAEVSILVNRVAPHLAPEALWLLSEFAVPRGWFFARMGKAVIFGLYQAFGWITGLPVRALPEYEAALQRAGMRLVESRGWLKGLLVAQLWRLSSYPHRQPLTSPIPPM